MARPSLWQRRAGATRSTGGYQAFLAREAEGIVAFREQQQAAFNAERERWIASSQAHFESAEMAAELGEDAPLGTGQHAVESHIAGNLWQVQVEEGASVKAGDILVILESMKMEIPLTAPATAWCAKCGYSPALRCARGSGWW